MARADGAGAGLVRKVPPDLRARRAVVTAAERVVLASDPPDALVNLSDSHSAYARSLTSNQSALVRRVPITPSARPEIDRLVTLSYRNSPLRGVIQVYLVADCDASEQSTFVRLPLEWSNASGCAGYVRLLTWHCLIWHDIRLRRLDPRSLTRHWVWRDCPARFGPLREASAWPVRESTVSSGYGDPPTADRHCAMEPTHHVQDSTLASGRLPAEVTSFVGRRTQLAAAKRELAATRLLTLTGIGGVGKTRLALRLAHDLRRSFAGGVYLVSLAGLREPALLDRTVAESLEVRTLERPRDALVAALRDRRVLLVLDNCEHLVDSVGSLVGALLPELPELHVLATSRTHLNLTGERLFAVPPLATPPVDDIERVPLAHYEAIQLLVERAQAMQVAVTEAMLPDLARLCQRLGGIPLALELAAARLKALAVPQILERLDDRFALLTGGDPHVVPQHHQTLRATVEWSHELCSPDERVLWARLSVFAGTFDLAAVEQVCPGGCLAVEDVLDLFDGLVRQSIVTVEHVANRARYHIMETLRQFGQEQFDHCEDAPNVRRRYASHYRAMVAEAAATWFSAHEVEVLNELRANLPNLRETVTAIGNDLDDQLATLAQVLDLARSRYWFFTYALDEGRMWLERSAERTGEPTSELHMAVWAVAAFMALCQGEHDDADRLRERYLTLRGRYPNGVGAATVDFAEGVRRFLHDACADALNVLLRARDRFLGLGAHGDAHMADLFAAMTVGFLTDGPTARPYVERLTADAADREAPWALSWAWWASALVELRFGEHRRAGQLLRDALALQEQIGDRWGPVWSVEVLAWWAAAARGDGTFAAQLLGAADRMRVITGSGVMFDGLRPFADLRAAAEAGLREHMPPAMFAAAYERGSQLDRNGIVQLALRRRSSRATPTEPSTRSAAAAPLSVRELQVARALEEGLTNAEIGTKLVISERTVETHVRHILDKLGMRNRQQIGAWVRDLDINRL